MAYLGNVFDDLAWQVEMGVDEALGEEPCLAQWQGRSAAVCERQPVAVQAKPTAEPIPIKQADRKSGARRSNTQVLSASVPKPPIRVMASSVAELREEIEVFEGCELKHLAMNLVFADGNPHADIMFIGDVPGEDEDRQGTPFVGPSGQLLDRMLQAIGLDREKAYLTNLIFWRPPGNRTPSEVELEACLPFTQQHIALVKPKILVVMGSSTAKGLLRTKESFSKIRGRWQEYTSVIGSGESHAIRCLPIYHPFYLLRQPAAKRQAWADLLNLKKEINELSD